MKKDWLRFAHVCQWRITDSIHKKGNNLCGYGLVYKPRCTFKGCRSRKLKGYETFFESDIEL